jgi:hypothetical protein
MQKYLFLNSAFEGSIVLLFYYSKKGCFEKHPAEL